MGDGRLEELAGVLPVSDGPFGQFAQRLGAIVQGRMQGLVDLGVVLEQAQGLLEHLVGPVVVLRPQQVETLHLVDGSLRVKRQGVLQGGNVVLVGQLEGAIRAQRFACSR